MQRSNAMMGAFAVLGGSALLAVPAAAHHGTAPHYILQETVEVSGTVVAWRVRNPHSYLTLEIEGENGPEELVCEAGGAAVVRRFGVSPDVLAVGETVTLTAAPGRVDPHICLMRTISLSDGRTFSFGDEGAPTPRPEGDQIVSMSIFGVWTPGAGAPVGTGGPTGFVPPQAGGEGAQGGALLAPPEPLLDHLTRVGREAHAAYDPYRDDPSLRCSPINPRRLWNAVGTGFEISRQGEDVLIHFEFMDADRTVHMNETAPPDDAERAVLGYSVGRMDGDALVIETSHFEPGVILQHVLDSQGELRGLLHSEDYTFSERIELNEETDELKVTFTYDDPTYFTEDAPFPTLTRFYKASPDPIGPYNCVPDVLEESETP